MLLKNKLKKKSLTKRSWNGLPATIRPSLFESSMYESVFSSVFYHIVGALLLWALVFVVTFFGIKPKIFPAPQMKVKDLEFNITNKHGKVKKAKKAALAKPMSQPTAEPERKTEKITPSVKPKASNKSSRNVIDKAFAKKSNTVPDFAMPMPNMKSFSSGLGSGTKSGARSAHSSGSSSGNVNNVFSLDGDDAEASGTTGFNKNKAKKVIATYDISPYVNELKRNISWNWKAPSNHDNKKVELFLRIARDGKIVILNVKKTSEIGALDDAALNAVRKCIPLHPLPSKYAKNYLDIIFTFSPNYVGSRY